MLYTFMRPDSGRWSHPMKMKNDAMAITFCIRHKYLVVLREGLEAPLYINLAD